MFLRVKTEVHFLRTLNVPLLSTSCIILSPACVIVHLKGCVLSAQTELFVSSLHGLIDHAGGSGFINRPHPLLSPGKGRRGESGTGKCHCVWEEQARSLSVPTLTTGKAVCNECCMHTASVL